MHQKTSSKAARWVGIIGAAKSREAMSSAKTSGSLEQILQKQAAQQQIPKHKHNHILLNCKHSKFKFWILYVYFLWWMPGSQKVPPQNPALWSMTAGFWGDTSSEPCTVINDCRILRWYLLKILRCDQWLQVSQEDLLRTLLCGQ